MSKNKCAKTRPRTNPYEIWVYLAGPWRWYVLKKYQTPEKERQNPYARWFCLVKSPIVPDGELGDVYVSEIKSVAMRCSCNLCGKPVDPAIFDSLSLKEFGISGMCQQCQDTTFGK